MGTCCGDSLVEDGYPTIPMSCGMDGGERRSTRHEPGRPWRRSHYESTDKFFIISKDVPGRPGSKALGRLAGRAGRGRFFGLKNGQVTGKSGDDPPTPPTQSNDFVIRVVLKRKKQTSFLCG